MDGVLLWNMASKGDRDRAAGLSSGKQPGSMKGDVTPDAAAAAAAAALAAARLPMGIAYGEKRCCLRRAAISEYPAGFRSEWLAAMRNESAAGAADAGRVPPWPGKNSCGRLNPGGYRVGG